MKKFIVAAVAMSLVAVSYSQGTFTIRRPADGSTVREVVSVRIPRGGIKESQYVGIFVNGKFFEAVAPFGPSDFDKNDFVYKLDTKKNLIPDGKLNIKCVLYGDLGDTATMIQESSVDLVLDNRTSIKPPEGGFRLRYSLLPGREYIYRSELRQDISTISEAQLRLGGRAAELSGEPMIFRFLYAVDNAYVSKSGREGLVRMQILPKEGKDYAILQTIVDPEPKRYYQNDMYPIYMRITDTGREVFGGFPIYVPIEGTSGFEPKANVFGMLPLPVLPSAGRKQGESWNATMMADTIEDLSKLHTLEKLTVPIPARGTLESIEWERGQRCARIRYKLTTGNNQLGGTQDQEQVVWFSLDKGMPIKIELSFTRSRRITETVATNSGGGGAGGSQPGRNRPSAGAQGSGGQGSGSAGAGLATGPNKTGTLNQDVPPGGSEEGGGPAGRGGGRQGAPGRGGFGGGGNTGGGGGGNRTRIIRQRTQIVMILEG